MACRRWYPFPRFPPIFSPKLQANIIEHVNLLRFVNLAPKFSNRARPEYRRFASPLGHGALTTFLALNPPTSGRMGGLRDKFHEHYDAVFRVSVCRIFSLPSSRIISTQRYPTACASCHVSVHATRGAFESAGVEMSNDAWAIAFVDHFNRCGGDTFVHTAYSC
jgi:hypothetical protein